MTHNRRQIDAIKSEMQHLRSRLPHDMDAARAKAKQFTDWKYYLHRYPTATAVGAGLLAYWIVPRRKIPQNVTLLTNGREPQMTAKATKKATVAGFVTSLLTTLITRAATQYAGGYANQMMNQFMHASSDPPPPAEATNGSHRRHESSATIHPNTSPSHGNGI